MIITKSESGKSEKLAFGRVDYLGQVQENIR